MQISSLLGNKPNMNIIIWPVSYTDFGIVYIRKEMATNIRGFLKRANLHKPNLHY